MTSRKKRAAGGFTLLEGAWVLYLTASASSIHCPAGGCLGPNFPPLYSQLLIILAVAFVVDGLFGLWGTWLAFPIGLILSLVLLVNYGYVYRAEFGYPYYDTALMQNLVGFLLAAAGIVTNAMALRVGSKLSEQANPMNLPVFG